MTHNSDDLSAGRDSTTVQRRWDGAERPCMDVIEAVAAATGRDVLDLPPLQRAVDTDALDVLLTEGTDGLQISFEYGGARVAVGSTGAIEVRTDGADRHN